MFQMFFPMSEEFGVKRVVGNITLMVNLLHPLTKSICSHVMKSSSFQKGQLNIMLGEGIWKEGICQLTFEML
jgi:hypothetical protein